MVAASQMTAIFILVTTWIAICTACNVDMAVYKVSVKYLWCDDTFPKDYPLHRPKAQWSPIFGQSHTASYTLYHVGDVAKLSVQNYAQYGKLHDLVKEGEEEPKVYDQFSAPAVGAGTGETGNMVFVDGGHSLVSMISRITPSPDWFIGLDSLDLCIDDSWIDQVTLDLQPLDAGAASGLTFTAPRWETVPPAPVSKHGPREPNHPTAGFYYPTIRELPPIAKVEFIKFPADADITVTEAADDTCTTVWRKKAGFKGSPVVLTEFLTRHRQSLYIQARKKLGMKNCWTMDGNIVPKLPDGSRRRIHGVQDLEDIPVDDTRLDDEGRSKSPSPGSAAPSGQHSKSRRAARKK